MLKLFPIETTIDKASSYEECIDFYKENDYKNIFINLDDEGKKIIDKITEIYPKQKIFLLNDKTEYLNNQNCELCTKEFNRHMIIKPINQDLLSKVICNKFNCEVKEIDSFTFTLKKINKLILKNFPYLTCNFNESYTTFKSERMSAQILLFVTDLLQEHNIKFEVLDYERIAVFRD